MSTKWRIFLTRLHPMFRFMFWKWEVEHIYTLCVCVCVCVWVYIYILWQKWELQQQTFFDPVLKQNTKGLRSQSQSELLSENRCTNQVAPVSLTSQGGEGEEKEGGGRVTDLCFLTVEVASSASDGKRGWERKRNECDSHLFSQSPIELNIISTNTKIAYQILHILNL